MEKEQHELLSFVKLHANKARITKDRCAHLVEFKNGRIPIDCTLTTMTHDDILLYFSDKDKNKSPLDKPLVRWLMQQIATYDNDKEVIMGIIFSEEIVLAHVVKKSK